MMDFDTESNTGKNKPTQQQLVKWVFVAPPGLEPGSKV